MSSPFKEALPFSGVWVALATPWTEAGTVDFGALERHIDWLAARGVHGLVPLGTTGECPTVREEEREEILRVVVHRAGQFGLGVMAGCGTNDTHSTIRHAETAARLGSHGILAITPYYNKPTQPGLRAHFLAVADKSPIPVILYHSLSRTGVQLDVSTLSTLLEHSNIVGMKEASGNHGAWVRIAEVFERRGKAYLAGDDDMFATILALGGRGIVSASANVIPEPFVEIWDRFKASDWPTGFQVQKSISPKIQALFCETNPGPVKFAMHRLGLCRNSLRLPLTPVLASSERDIDSALGLSGSL